MRILFISTSVIFMVAVGLMTARFWGLSQQYQLFTNSFDLPKVYDVIAWEQAELLQKKSDLIVWAGVYQGKDGDLLVHPTQAQTPNIKTLPDSPSEGTPHLVDLLRKHPASRFILSVNDNKISIHQKLSELIKQEKATERILFQSDYNVLLTALKELSPTALFGSSHADLMRLRTFDSGYILPATPFKGDALIAPLTLRKISVVDQNIVSEMRRRQKRIILGPISNDVELQQAQALKPDGLFILDADLAQKVFLNFAATH